VKSSEPALVLLADDDPDDVFFMERAFRHSALPDRLFVVANGLEALAYLRGSAPYGDRQSYPLPGLLVLDLKMPLMDGFQVLEWLKGRSEFNHLPIVVLSGSDLPADMHKAKALGADDYRVKTANITHLTTMVHELHARWLNGHLKGASHTAAAS